MFDRSSRPWVIRPGNRNRLVDKRGGFTLFEMVLAITIAGIVAGVTYPMISASAKSYMVSRSIHEIMEESQIAMFRMYRELSNVKPGGVVAAATDEVTFTYTSDTGTARTVRYYLNGSNLMIDMNGAVEVLAEGFRDLQFTYNSAVPADIRLINWSITSFSNDLSMPLRSAVFLRSPT